MEIRKGVRSDSAMLHVLGNSSYRAQFAALWHKKEEMEQFLQQEYACSVLQQSLVDPDVCWLIAETDRPVGFAKFTWQSTIPGTDLTGLFLNKLYLAPQETGKEYGKRLFAEVILRAKREAIDFLWLEVLEQNPRARRFYAGLGMQHIKDVTFRSASQQSTVHLMGMPLQASL